MFGATGLVNMTFRSLAVHLPRRSGYVLTDPSASNRASACGDRLPAEFWRLTGNGAGIRHFALGFA